MGAETATWHATTAKRYAIFVKDYKMKRDIPLTETKAHIALYGREGKVVKMSVPVKDQGRRRSRLKLINCSYHCCQPTRIDWL